MSRMVPLLALSLLVAPADALASVVTVPDDYAAIQAGLDSWAGTVWVRAGEYTEVPISSSQTAPPKSVSPGRGRVLCERPAAWTRPLRGRRPPAGQGA